MKIGDYVRTPYGIARIEEIKPDDKHKTIWYTVDKAQYHCFLVQPKDIIKSSPKIIDLIEVGDYVNGYRVVSVYDYGIYIEIPFIDQESIGCNEDLIRIEEIKSIVTKEQFESMEYRIGE